MTERGGSRDYAALPAIAPVAEPRLYTALQRLARQRRTSMADIDLTATPEGEGGDLSDEAARRRCILR